MLETIKQNWENILEGVRDGKELSDVGYRTWIAPLEPVSLDHNILNLYFPGDKASADFIHKRYASFFRYVIEELTGIVCEIRISNSREEEAPPKKSSRPDFSIANLNANYTFDSFVVGQSNMVAHAASVAVAEFPGEEYNPLYIYGGSGLGKTHLMQSIAHHILRNNPGARVLYVTFEKFLTDYVTSLDSTSSISRFREKYRNVDVLLMDDIQFIYKKESTQDELFHTFNSLRENGKQIVISSDRLPKEIDDLEERLRSRFEQGLTVDIGLPDYETRMAILRKKEEMAGYNIDNEVINYIATHIKSNIRELEGALTKIVAFSRVKARPINLELAEEALQDHINPDAPQEISLPFILDMVSDHFGISSADILSKKKDAEIVYPRQIFMYLAKKMTDFPLDKIGLFLGGRDHSTVLYGKRKIEKQLGSDTSLQNTIEVLQKKMNP